MIKQHQAVPIMFHEIFFQISLIQIKKFIKKDFSGVPVGSVAQDGCTLFFWVENDSDPLIVYTHLLQELSRRFSWILQRQIRIVDGAIEIFWSECNNIYFRLVSKFEFNQRVAGVSRNLIAVDSPIVLERYNSGEE